MSDKSETYTPLKDKRAVVTGGSRGIGRAVVERLLEAGARVTFCARSQRTLDKTIQELSGRFAERVFGKRADISKPEQVADLFSTADEKMQGLDILVNNAGLAHFGTVVDVTSDQWQQVLETNLFGVYYCSSEAIRRMRNGGGGFIVNISSLAAKNAFAGGAAYNASKFGLNGLTEAMMLDHRYENIRIADVMPGSVATEFNSQSGGADWKIAPEDVAEVVAAILSMPARTLVSRVEMRPSRPRK